jgi:hypothetical protein
MAASKRVPALKKVMLNRVIDRLKAFGGDRKLPKGTTVRDLINEGRRY